VLKHCSLCILVSNLQTGLTRQHHCQQGCLCAKLNKALASAGFNAQYLLHHERCLRTRIADIEQQAAQLVGSSINLSSASQLSVALYDTLALPPPQQRSDRSVNCMQRDTNDKFLQGGHI